MPVLPYALGIMQRKRQVLCKTSPAWSLGHTFPGEGSDNPKETGYSKPGEAGSPPRAQVLGAGHLSFLPLRDTCLSGLVAAGTQYWQVHEALCPWEVGARVLGVASVWSSQCPCWGL